MNKIQKTAAFFRDVISKKKDTTKQNKELSVGLGDSWDTQSIVDICSLKDKEVIQQSLKIKGKTFKCTFTMVSVNSKVNLRASKLACSPGKPKKQRASNIKLEGTAATYTVSVLINPSRITKASMYPVSTTTTTTTTTTPAPAASKGQYLG